MMAEFCCKCRCTPSPCCPCCEEDETAVPPNLLGDTGCEHLESDTDERPLRPIVRREPIKLPIEPEVEPIKEESIIEEPKPPEISIPIPPKVKPALLEVKERPSSFDIKRWRSLNDEAKRRYHQTMPPILADFVRLTSPPGFPVTVRDIKSAANRSEARFEVDSALEDCTIRSEWPIDFLGCSTFPIRWITRLLEGPGIQAEFPNHPFSSEDLPQIIDLQVTPLPPEKPVEIFLQFPQRDLFISGMELLRLERPKETPPIEPPVEPPVEEVPPAPDKKPSVLRIKSNDSVATLGTQFSGYTEVVGSFGSMVTLDSHEEVPSVAVKLPRTAERAKVMRSPPHIVKELERSEARPRASAKKKR